MRRWLFVPTPVSSAVEFIELLALVQAAADTASSTSIAVNATGPNRKLVGVYGYDSGSARTLSAFTYNTVAFTIPQSIDGSSDGVGIGYIDDTNLPTDSANHTLTCTLSGAAAALMIRCLHYRNVAQGAPTDSDQHSNANPSTKTMTGLTAGALAVAGIEADTSVTFAWDNGNERSDEPDAGTTMTLSTADIVGTAGTSQAMGATSSVVHDLVMAAWNQA